MGAKIYNSTGYKKHGLSRASSYTTHNMISPSSNAINSLMTVSLFQRYRYLITFLLLPFLSKMVYLLRKLTELRTGVLKLCLVLKSSAFLSDLKCAQMFV